MHAPQLSLWLTLLPPLLGNSALSLCWEQELPLQAVLLGVLPVTRAAVVVAVAVPVTPTALWYVTLLPHRHMHSLLPSTLVLPIASSPPWLTLLWSMPRTAGPCSLTPAVSYLCTLFFPCCCVNCFMRTLLMALLSKQPCYLYWAVSLHGRSYTFTFLPSFLCPGL